MSELSKSAEENDARIGRLAASLCGFVRYVNREPVIIDSDIKISRYSNSALSLDLGVNMSCRLIVAASLLHVVTLPNKQSSAESRSGIAISQNNWPSDTSVKVDGLSIEHNPDRSSSVVKPAEFDPEVALRILNQINPVVEPYIWVQNAPYN